jgi:hypothetical protein
LSNPKNLSFLQNSLNYTTPGDGQVRLISIPQQGISGVYEIINSALYITDDNGNGTIASVFPSTGAGDAIGLVMPNSTPTVLSAIQAIEIPSGVGGSALGWNMNLLGSGVPMEEILALAGVGTSRSIWLMNQDRKIYVPQGYVFGLWIQDAGDATLHTITVNLVAEVNGPGLC